MMGVTTLPIRVRGAVEIHFPNIFKKFSKNLDILGKESMINCELLNKHFKGEDPMSTKVILLK